MAQLLIRTFGANMTTIVTVVQNIIKDAIKQKLVIGLELITAVKSTPIVHSMNTL